MKLTLKNVGKVKEASIQLNGLTVIAGENDSGKSTIGKTLLSKPLNDIVNIASLS